MSLCGVNLCQMHAIVISTISPAAAAFAKQQFGTDAGEKEMRFSCIQTLIDYVRLNGILEPLVDELVKHSTAMYKAGSEDSSAK